MHKRQTLSLIIVATFLVVMGLVGGADAATNSNNYRIDEDFIGPGGQLESNSANYKLDSGQSSAGNAGGVGESASTNFQTQSGSTTTSDPRLSCSLGSSSLNFGGLSTSVTATGTATFSVLNYTSYGYVVNILGTPPTNGSHTLSALASNAPSATGSEQFGINLRDNSTPNIGVDVVQVPSGTFSFGAPTTNYNIVNSFRYVNGESIASSVKTSGQTDYTMSYIINASTTTPGGAYMGNQTILCTGTF